MCNFQIIYNKIGYKHLHRWIILAWTKYVDVALAIVVYHSYFLSYSQIHALWHTTIPDFSEKQTI